MRLQQQYKSYNYYQSQKQTTQIITKDNHFIHNGKIISEILEFQQLRSLKISQTGLQSIDTIIQLPLTKLDLSNNRITSIDGIQSMTTLQLFSISSNPIRSLSSLPLQLKAFHCSHCLLEDNKQSIRALYQLTSLTCLDIPRSTIEEPIDPIEQLQTLRQLRHVNKLIKTQKEYYERIHNTPAPLLFDSDVYIRLLVLFLPNLLLLNKERITTEIRQMIKETVNEEIDMNINSSYYSILQETSTTQSNTIHKLNTIQRRYSSFITSIYSLQQTPYNHFIPLDTTVRQVEFNKYIPGQIVVGGTDGSIKLMDIQQNEMIPIESPFSINSFGICWNNQYSQKSQCLIGNEEGILCLYDFSSLSHDHYDNNIYDGNGMIIERRIQPKHTITGLNRISSTHLNCTGNTFLTTGYLTNVNLYDYETMHITHLYSQMHRETVNVAKFANQHPELLTTCSFDKSACIWDTRTDCRQPVHKFVGETLLITTIFSSNDQNVLIAGADNYVMTLDLRNMKCIRMKLERRWNTDGMCRAYYCNGDESIVVSNSCERSLHILRSYDGKRILDCHADSVSSEFTGTISVRPDPFNDFNFLSIMCNDAFDTFGLFSCQLI